MLIKKEGGLGPPQVRWCRRCCRTCCGAVPAGPDGDSLAAPAS